MLKEMARRISPGSPFGYDLPPREWFQYARESSRYTPDIAVLEEHSWQLYFHCDDTKEDLLGEREYKTPGFTQQSFNYWNPSAPFMPIVPMEAKGLRNPLTFYPPIAKIKGEIFKIRPQALIMLDTEKENTVQFHRRKVRILVPFRMLKFIHDKENPPPDIEFVSPEGHVGRTYEALCIVRAWMYVGIPQYWDNLITAFDYGSVETFESKNRSWCRTYYQYRPPK